MTSLVASVTDVREGESALAGGVDVIPVAGPGANMTDAASPDAIRRIVAAAAKRKPVSAYSGSLAMEPDAMCMAVEETAAAGADQVWIGFPPVSDAAAFTRALAPCARRTKLVAVLFADLGPDLALLSMLPGHGFSGVMMGVAGKEAGRLLDHLPPERLSAFVDRSRALGLEIGMGGALEAPDIPRLLPLTPDFLSFRRALTIAGERSSPLSAEAIARIRSLIPAAVADIRTPRVATDTFQHKPGPPPDRIFVRDFVLPVHIGAYSFEHGHPQKVRFDVAAEVPRPPRGPEDLRSVVSYDLIMDGIRAVVGRGHVELAETLAEEIAAQILADPRILSVTVRIEKLELGAGAVGVEIMRRQGEQDTSAGRWEDER